MKKVGSKMEIDIILCGMSKKYHNVGIPLPAYRLLKAHCEESGLLIGKFVEKAIREKLKKEEKDKINE